MSSYYQDYLLLSREEKLSMLMDLFHNPATTPEHMAIIHKEFQKVLHWPEEHPSLANIIYLKSDVE